MKHIEAIIRPWKLDEVVAALRRVGVGGLTISEVQGYGRQKGRTQRYRGAEYAAEFVPKLRLELTVSSGSVGEVLAVLTRAARTGEIGDGKVYVDDIRELVRIRTGERGEAAL